MAPGATAAPGLTHATPGAEVRLRADGTAPVATGTAALTIFPQIAAHVLGLPLENVALAMGDTRLPEAGPTYGSSSTMGVGTAVLRAAEDARTQLARLANLPPGEVEMAGERIRRTGGSGGVTIAEAMGDAGTRAPRGSR